MVAQQGEMKSPVSLSTDLDFYFNFSHPFPSLLPLLPSLSTFSFTSSDQKKKRKTFVNWNWPLHISQWIYIVNGCMLLKRCLFFPPWAPGNAGWQCRFPSPTQYSVVHFVKMCSTGLRGPHWHANVFTDNQSTAGLCGRHHQLGLTWNWTAENKPLPAAAVHYLSGISILILFIEHMLRLFCTSISKRQVYKNTMNLTLHLCKWNASNMNVT